MKNFKIISWVVCAITVLFLTTACSSNVDDADSSPFNKRVFRKD